MKKFRIVEKIGSTGARRYRVQHLVFRFWWSSTWFWHRGGADYDMEYYSLPEAEAGLEEFKEDYRLKQQSWTRRIVKEDAV